MAATLTSKRFTARDEAEAVELAFSRGWSDGLPVVPPTEARVKAMLQAARLDPDRQIAFITHRAVYITAEKVAINAVMAGCRPEYMPVVVAAVEGIGDPALELPRAGHLDGRRRGADDRQRADRPRARHQRRRQPLRAGLAGQPHHRPRACAWSCATCAARCPDCWTAARSAIPASCRS